MDAAPTKISCKTSDAAKYVRGNSYFCGSFLVATAILKLLSVTIGNNGTGDPDVLLNIPNSVVIPGAALIEIAVACFLFFRPVSWLSISLLGSLLLSFVTYRFFVYKILGVARHCPCTGNLFVSNPEINAVILISVTGLLYAACASTALVALLWRPARKETALSHGFS